MPNETKRKALSENKRPILGLLAEGNSEYQVASILEILKMADHKDKVKQQTLGKITYGLAESKNKPLS